MVAFTGMIYKKDVELTSSVKDPFLGAPPNLPVCLSTLIKVFLNSAEKMCLLLDWLVPQQHLLLK